jgi:hypothetical protein
MYFENKDLQYLFVFFKMLNLNRRFQQLKIIIIIIIAALIKLLLHSHH